MSNPDSFANLVKLLAVYSEATIRLSEMQAATDSALMEALDESQGDYVTAQTAVEQAEAAIKELAKAHPEWMTGRAIKTPYGTVKFTRSTRVEAKDDAMSIILIQQCFPPEEAGAYLRRTTELNLETLATLSDDDLALIRMCRVTEDSVSVKPAKVDMGKAAKAKPQPVEAP